MSVIKPQGDKLLSLGMRFEAIPRSTLHTLRSIPKAEKALSIYTYLISKPVDWIIRPSDIMKQVGISESTYHKNMKILKDIGCLVVTTIYKPESNKYHDSMYVFCSIPLRLLEVDEVLEAVASELNKRNSIKDDNDPVLNLSCVKVNEILEYIARSPKNGLSLLYDQCHRYNATQDSLMSKNAPTQDQIIELGNIVAKRKRITNSSKNKIEYESLDDTAKREGLDLYFVEPLESEDTEIDSEPLESEDTDETPLNTGVDTAPLESEGTVIDSVPLESEDTDELAYYDSINMGFYEEDTSKDEFLESIYGDSIMTQSEASKINDFESSVTKNGQVEDSVINQVVADQNCEEETKIKPPVPVSPLLPEHGKLRDILSNRVNTNKQNDLKNHISNKEAVRNMAKSEGEKVAIIELFNEKLNCDYPIDTPCIALMKRLNEGEPIECLRAIIDYHAKKENGTHIKNYLDPANVFRKDIYFGWKEKHWVRPNEKLGLDAS